MNSCGPRRGRFIAVQCLTVQGVMASAGSALAVPPVVYSTVAVSGEAAPGLKGLTYARLGGLTINDAGQWVFHAELTGPGVTADNEGSLWSNRAGVLALEQREGTPSPLADLAFGSLTYAGINPEGKLSITGTVTPTLPGEPLTRVALFVDRAGELATLASEGTSPGFPPGTFTYLRPAPMNAVGFSALGSGTFGRVWSDRSGALEVIANPGSPAPGVALGTFQHFDAPAQGADGTLVFRARVQSSDVFNPFTPANNAGIWRFGVDEQRLIARLADSAPGYDADVVFADLLAHPSVSNAGLITFWARLTGGSAVAGSDQAIFSTRTKDSVAPLVRAGDDAHGVGDGSTYFAFTPVIVVNETGDCAFVARLAGQKVTPGNNAALYVFPASASEPRLVAREGDEVFPTTGIVYASYVGPAMNNHARVAFLARVSGTGITSANNLWLLAEGPDHRLVRVAATGQAFEVAPGDVRTVRDIAFEAGSAMEGHAQFTIDSTLAFRLNFTDFTDALVTARVPCGPDWNADGVINSTDVSDFINDWFTDQANGTTFTDFNFDGVANSTDVSDFINAWFGGCEGL